MNISQVSGSSPLNHKLVDNNGFKIIDLKTTLTDDDKNIVKIATGDVIGETLHVNSLAVGIALSRSDGSLKGPVTESFLKQLGQSPQVSPSVISKAIEFLKSEQHSKTHSSEVNVFA